MITELTKEQESKFQFYVDKWLNIGLSTDECDFVKAKEAAKLAYKCADLEEPKYFFLFDCPVTAAIGTYFIRSLFENNNIDKRSLGRIEIRIWNQVCNQIKSQKINIKAEKIKEKPQNEKITIWDKAKEYINTQIYGCQDASWLSFYDFINTELKIDCSKLSGLMELSKHCGWWSPFDEVVIFQHKPKEIHFNANKQLHNENGPAVSYRSGLIELWRLNGVEMTKDHVMTPAEKLDPYSILKEQNVEVRRELIRKVGIERMLACLKHRVIEKRGNYELLGVELSGTVKDARYLKMTNPSIGCFHLEGVEGDTVQEALNFRARNILKPGENWEPAELT